MATVNNGSIVDYLKSTGGDSSFGARADLAVAQGIVTSKSQYLGTAEQNTTLLKKLQTATPAKAPAPAVTTPSKTGQDASVLINGGQQADIASQGGAPGTRSSTATLTDFYKELTTAMAGTVGARPDTISLADRMKSLRAEANVGELESRLTDLEAERQDMEALKRERVGVQRDKRVAQGVIEGRVSAVERQENERIDAVNRELSYVSNQLNNKYTAINQMLQLEQTDYQNAVASYDAKYSQVVNTLNLARGLQADQLSLEQKAQDSARANLQVMYNAMYDGAIGMSDMTDTQKTFISKLEAEAGLPSGFYSLIKDVSNDAKMLTSTSYVNTDGKKFTDVIFQNKDGSLSTKQIYHGVVPVSSEDGVKKPNTDTQRLRDMVADYSYSLQSKVGQDGKVSNEDWNYARSKWQAEGFSVADFDEEFAGYVNTKYKSGYNISDPMLLMGK